jgi:hypothetical protein
MYHLRDTQFFDEKKGIKDDTFEHRKSEETFKITAGIAETRRLIPNRCQNLGVNNAPNKL